MVLLRCFSVVFEKENDSLLTFSFVKSIELTEEATLQTRLKAHVSYPRPASNSPLLAWQLNLVSCIKEGGGQSFYEISILTDKVDRILMYLSLK